MKEAEIFRKHPDVDGLVTKFPVAVKASRVSQEVEGAPSGFVSVMVEETPYLVVNDENVVFLREREALEWWSIVHSIVKLSDTHLWRFVVLLTIGINYWWVTYSYFFQRKTVVTTTLPALIVFDVIYAFDFLFALIAFLSKKIQMHMTNRPRSKRCIIFDGILVFPYSMVYILVTHKKLSNTFFFLWIIAFLRMYQICKFFSTKSKNAGVDHQRYFMIQYIVFFLVLLHTFSCIWIIMGCPMGSEEATGWAHSSTIYTLNLTTNFKWYLAATYFTMSMITNVGFADIEPITVYEKIVAIAAMCLGFTLTTGIFIGSLSSFYVNKTERHAELRRQLYFIRQHLKLINLDRKSAKHILSYYKVLWKKKKGVREAESIDLLPLPLQMEIQTDVNLALLQCSRIFRDKPRSFMRSVSLMMKHEFYLTDQIIYYQHVVKYKMIFVASGIIEILSDEDDQSPIISFGPGTCLGEASLVFTLPARATVRAAKYTELQVLYKKDYLTMTRFFPKIYTDIRKYIMEEVANAAVEQKKMENVQDHISMSVYTSHIIQNSAIRKLKNRLDPGYAHLVDPKEQFYYGALSLYHLRENQKKKKGKILYRTASFPWILQPDTNLTWTWDFVIVLNAFFTAIVYPYFVAYEREFPEWLDSLSFFVDVLNLLDIYVTLTTAIAEKEGMIQNFRDILSYRLATFGFYLDVFSCFYPELFAYALQDIDRWYYILKLNRLLKSYRICKFFTRLEESLTINIFLVRLVKYPIYLTMCPYWFGAILYMKTCFHPVCDKTGWFHLKKVEGSTNHITSPCAESALGISMYFALNCLASVGFGDILPGNLSEIVLVCVGVIFGILIFGYCIAEFSATFTHNSKTKTDFQATLFPMMKYFKDHAMTAQIKNRIINFFILQWNINKGSDLGTERGLYYNATEQIQQKVMVNETVDTIVKIPLFQNANMDFIHVIAAHSKLRVLPPNEVVVYSKGKTNEMYVIAKGYCSQQLDQNTSRILTPGSHFGLRALLYEHTSISTVTTLTHVQLISVTSEAFQASLSLFPLDASEIIAARNDPDVLRILNEEVQPKLAKFELTSDVEKSWKQFSLKEAITASFLDVRKYCKARNEDYNAPFRKLGSFRWVKYFLVPFCILPNKPFLKCWVFIRLMSAVLLALLTPIHLVTAPYTYDYLDHLMLLFDIVAYLDLYIMMLVGYYGKQNQLIVHPCKTAMHYIKGLFFFDVILCFPWVIVIQLLRPDHNEDHSAYADSQHPHLLHSIIRLIAIFQVYRLPSALNYLESDITKKGDMMEVLKFVPFTLVFISMWAGIIIKTSCKVYHIDELGPNATIDELFEVEGMNKLILTMHTMFCKDDSWIDLSRYYYHRRAVTVFNVALYWVTAAVTGAGFGDLTANDGVRLIMSMMMTMSGILYFGYAYASISSHKAVSNQNLLLYQQMAREMATFMEEENIPEPFCKNIMESCEYQWIRTGGMEPNVILRNLHPALHEDAVLNMYEQTIREVPLFEDADQSFIRIMGKEMHERYFKKGQTIYEPDDVVEYVCIIYKGQIEIISRYEENQAFMGAGGLLGNITSKSKSKFSVTAIAVRNVDLLYLKADIFHNIIKSYPAIKKKLDALTRDEKDFIMPMSVLVDDDSEGEVDEAYFGDASSKRSISTSRASTGGTSTVMSIAFTKSGDILRPSNWGKAVLLPDAPVFKKYSHVIVIAALLSCIISTYQFAFYHNTIALLCCNVILDLIFLFKMVLDLHKPYLDIHRALIMDPKKIRKRYFKQPKVLAFELLPNLPICYFLFNFNFFYFAAARLIVLLRFHYISEYFDKQSAKLMVNRLYLKITNILVLIILTLHIATCIWYMMACYRGVCETFSWINTMNDGEYDPSEKFRGYIASIYFMVSVFTTTGMSEILPSDKIQICFVSAVTLSAKFFIGIIIGDIISVFDSYSSSLVQYEHNIGKLRDYLRNENVSDHQMKKMWNYVRQLWKRSKGYQIPRMISILSFHNRCALMYEVYGTHVRNSYLFNGAQAAFLKQLCSRMTQTIYFPGNYIVQKGDSDQTMYFIHQGEVEILTIHHNLLETTYDVLHTGEMFGLAQGLFVGVPHHFSFRAKSNVKIVSLQLNRWQDLLDFFPETQHIIYARAHALYSHAV